MPVLWGDARCLRSEDVSREVCLPLCLVGDLLREAEVNGSSVYRKAAAVKTPGFRSVIVLMVSGATMRLEYIFGSWAVIWCCVA